MGQAARNVHLAAALRARIGFIEWASLAISDGDMALRPLAGGSARCLSSISAYILRDAVGDGGVLHGNRLGMYGCLRSSSQWGQGQNRLIKKTPRCARSR